MEFGKQNRATVVELTADEFLHPDLLFDPQRDGHQERPDPGRGAGQIGVQYPVEFDEGLFVKRDEIDLLYADAAFVEAVFHGLFWKRGIMLLACESLFLRGG